MIDKSNWKNYTLGNLFELVNSKAYHNKDIVEVGDENGLLYVTRSKFNNGIKCKVEKRSEYIINPAGTISFGAENADFFYQTKEYITGNNMYYINTCNISEMAALFLKGVLEATFTKKFSFSNGMVPNKIRNEIISLPATSDGQPDWAYMESYMKQIMEESEKNLENLKKSNHDNYLIDINEWGKFRVGDLFSISRPVSRSSQEHNKGKMNFVASGCFNNGVTDCLEPKNEADFDEGQCITVSPVDGYAFYQKDRFLGRGGAGSSIIIMRNDNLNELNGKYVCTVIRFACKNWTYANMGNKDKLAETVIKLPITLDGQPDWAYMESYMKKVMNKSEQVILTLNNENNRAIDKENKKRGL